MTTTIDATDIARLLADKLITFLETGQAPEGLFTAWCTAPATGTPRGWPSTGLR